MLAARPAKGADHLDPNPRAGGEFGDPGRASCPVDDLQHAIRPLVDPDRRHAINGIAEACDLAMELVGIGTREARRGPPQLGRIDVAKVSRQGMSLTKDEAAEQLRLASGGVLK